MASTNSKPEEQNAIDQLDSQLKNVGQQVETNKKAIYVGLGALILVAAIFFAYIYFIRGPKTEKAYEALNQVEITAMGNDSIAAAGYAKVADSYSGAPANLARLSAGEALYNMGKYAEAAKYLAEFSTKDKVLQANASTLLGDCYVNLKKYDNAIDAFNDAIKQCDGNPEIAPRVLLKQAVVYDAQKKYDKALACYENIKNNYPSFKLGNNIDVKAYIEREKARLGK